MKSARKKLTTDTLIQYKGRYYTGTDIKAMREWVSDCQWEDVDEGEIEELSDKQILRGVDAHVHGGLHEFIHNMM